MKNFFEYLETSTQQERNEISEKLKQLFFDASKDTQETFAEHRRNRKSTTARQHYFEAAQRLGGISDTLEALGVDVLALQDEFYNL